MTNWTDPVIHWNQLGSSQLKRLVDTWGKDEAFIAKYDKKHGIPHTPIAMPAKAVTKTTSKTVVKVPAKRVAKAPVRQKHTGADGEIKFVEHRNLFVGFMGGKVVVNKRTEAACREVLINQFGAKCGE